MKINEVEQLVGVTKRNIRFYEKEGLLSPGRNADNGYRNYDEADVEALRKIKLLRKLDVPLEEIRQMQLGELTLADGLRRHDVRLERAQKNLGTMRSLCQELARTDEQLPNLDAGRWLAEVERMEQELGQPAEVIATGGLAGSVLPLCRRKFRLEPDLLLRGLAVLYEKNK